MGGNFNRSHIEYVLVRNIERVHHFRQEQEDRQLRFLSMNSAESRQFFLLKHKGRKNQNICNCCSKLSFFLIRTRWFEKKERKNETFTSSTYFTN